MQQRPLGLQDVEEVTALIQRFEAFWSVPLITPVEQMKEELTEPSLDLARDTLGYWVDGTMVAYGLIWHRPSGERLERAYLQGVVHPDFRGRGIGRTVLSWEIERATEILEEIDNSLPKFIRADEWDWIEDAHRLYRRLGMEPVRYFKDMLRELSGPVAVTATDGVRIVGFDRSFDDQTRQAWNESFADHWGSTPLDAASYAHRIEGEGTREDLSFLAVAGDEVVGLTLNGTYPDDEAVTGRREGWIEVLGVKREWRGRGVAKALIESSLNVFVDADMTHAALNVDSDNRTGAYRLYEGLGFVPAAGTITSEIAL